MTSLATVLSRYFVLLYLLVKPPFSSTYVGIYRFSNGTDVDLYRLQNGNCEKELIGGKRIDPPAYPQYCGYQCNLDGGRTSSVYKLENEITGCMKDFEILAIESCSLVLGSNWKIDQVNALTVSDIENDGFLYHDNQIVSRCSLKDQGCSVKFRNMTTGWQHFLHSNCFEFKVASDGSTAKAYIKINCVLLYQRLLEGLMFRLELECHQDRTNATFNTCLLLKVPGIYIDDESESLVSMRSCTVIPTIPPTLPSSTVSTSDDFMDPYGWIIIGGVVAFLLIIFVVIIVWCCRRKKNYAVDNKSQECGIEPDIKVEDGSDRKTTYSVPNKLETSIPPESYKEKVASLNLNMVLITDNPTFVPDDIEEETSGKFDNSEMLNENSFSEEINHENTYEDPDVILGVHKGKQESAPLENGVLNSITEESKERDSHPSSWFYRNEQEPDKSNDLTPRSSVSSGDSEDYWNKPRERNILARKDDSLLRAEVLGYFGLDIDEQADENINSDKDAYRVTDLLENHLHLENEQVTATARTPSSRKINFSEHEVMF